jgi:acyl-CoA reductase-like NAD-dependent aldehyde dehydrogenase
MTRIAHFIDGQRRAGENEQHDIDVFNPGHRRRRAHVPVADAALVDDVVAIARNERRRLARTPRSPNAPTSSSPCDNFWSSTPKSWRP